MKLLATADLHIRDYSKFNVRHDGELGWIGPVPERLRIYDDLAQDIASVIRNEKCEAVILAGDLLDIPSSSPLVLNRADSFLSVVSKEAPVYVIHGQHDLDTKIVDEYARELTSLSVFDGKRVFYHHDEVVDVGNIEVYFYGWSSVLPTKYKDADMFVAHGMIQGCANYLGYTFNHGYDPRILSSKYKFSVIGDIHNHQTFYNNVLIPGPPIQNKFDDSPVNGVWVINTDGWTFKFVEFNRPVYSKFYMVNDDSDIPKDSPPNHFYKKSPKKREEFSDEIETTSQTINLWEIIKTVIESLKTDNQMMLLKMARQHYDKVTSRSIDSRNIPQVILKSVKISNFMSVQDYYLEFPSGITLVSGSIGSGKTTLLEAICYGLFGETTRGEYKESILPVSYNYTDEPQVELEFSVADNEYKIVRRYKTLVLNVNGKNVSGARMSDTDKTISEIIGITFDEFASLIYFSQEAGSFFHTLSPKRQMALLSMFLGKNEKYIDMLAVDIKAAHKNYSKEVDESRGGIRKLQDLNKSYAARRDELKANQIDLQTKQLEVFREAGFTDVASDVVNLMIQGNTVEAANLYFNTDVHALKDTKAKALEKKSDLVSTRTQLDSAYRSNKEKLKTTKQKRDDIVQRLKHYKQGVCNECGQKRPTEPETLNEMVNKIMGFESDLETLHGLVTDEIQRQIDELDEQIEKLALKISECSKVISKAESFMGLKQTETQDFSELEQLEKFIVDNERQIELVSKDIQMREIIVECYKILTSEVFHDRGVKSACVQSVGKILSSYVNDLLGGVGLGPTANGKTPARGIGSIQVEINTIKRNKSGNLEAGFDVVGLFDGCRVPYSTCSGGQKMLLDLVSCVSIYNLLGSIYGLPKGLLSFIAMDESVKYLDDKSLDPVRDILESIQAEKVFVVSHDQKLKQLIRQVIKVDYQDGISVYS